MLIPRQPPLPIPLLPVERLLHSSLGARLGSFDTDAFGILLRMKSKVCQTLTNSFMLSSQS
jgi:hypothetical protein